METNGRHFADDIYLNIFYTESIRILIRIRIKFYGPIDSMSVLAWVVAWRQTGAKPLPEPNMTQFTDTCISYAPTGLNLLTSCRDKSFLPKPIFFLAK